MKKDIIKNAQSAVVNGKKYVFAADYSILSEIEESVGRGVYIFYGDLFSEKGITLDESLKLLCCTMKKNHSEEEIVELKNKIIERPGLWLNLRDVVVGALVLALLPPEILDEMKIKPKKKTK